MEDTIKLVADSGDNAVMPNISKEQEEQGKALISPDITGIIAQKVVQTLIVPESVDIDPRNYVFDFSECESISVFKKEALKGLVSFDRKDVTLYLYKKNKLIEFGKGDSYELDRIIPLMVQYVFDEDTKVYKDYTREKGAILVKDVDITKLRLNL